MSKSWVHYGELIFLGFMLVEFLSIHLTDAMQTISSVCLKERQCSAKLRPGITFDRQVDLSDYQWRDFRLNLPLLSVAAVLFVLLSQGIRRLPARSVHQLRVFFYCLVSAVFLVYLNGAFSLLVVLLTLPSFAIAQLMKGHKLAPAFTWVYAFLVLFTNEWYHEYYTFGALSRGLAFLDSYRGVSRWHVSFNMVVLRMISYNMDLYWATRGAKEKVVPGKPVDESDPEADLKKRVQESLPLEHYNFAFYFAYLFYVPLHIAGPTMTFNSFASQVLNPPTHITAQGLFTYFLRFLLALGIMEVASHYLYCYALTTSGAYSSLSPFYIGMLGYLSLHMIWLKFLIIWRFFRLWALLDGIETVENMNRCMSNNYNLQGFWRSWHRSFNRWLIRYIYVPLGGKNRNLLNTLLVFTFTALWHDLTMKLLAWGWLIFLFVLPETLISAFFGAPRFKKFRESWYYRYLCALGGSLNIMLMMIANLVGFSAGTHGVWAYLQMIISFEGLPFLLASVFYLFVGVLIMFEVRDYEARHNINKGF